MESMDMTETIPKGQLPLLHLWFLHDTDGIKTTTLSEVDLKEFSVKTLKEIAVHGKTDVCFTTNADEIDILHNGVVLDDRVDLSLEALNVKPNSVLHIIRKLGIVNKDKNEMCNGIQKEPGKKISNAMITELVIALKTMILSPAFITTVEKLSDPQMLRNIIAVVPNLRFDPVGIAIIQDPSMILYLADEESLKALAQTRPWIVEALNFISATVHQQDATTSRGASGNRSSSLLSYFRQLDEEGDEEDEAPAAGQPGPGTITRQQLAAALESFNNLRSLTTGQAAPRPPQQTTPRPGTNPGPRSQPAASSTPPPLTGELVARAMREALSQLPPEQRDAQMNAFRNLALSLNQSQQQQPTPAPVPVFNPPQQQPPTTGGQSDQYRTELARMRQMGITDERLSIMALRVSDGDVDTAVELIRAGWHGEGASD